MDFTAHIQIPTLSRYISASVYLAMNAASIVANTLLALVFVKGKQTLPSAFRPFMRISSQLLIASFLQLFGQCVLVVPESFAGRQLYHGKSVVTNFISFVWRLSLNSVICFTFLLTVHRFCIFFFPKWETTFFQRSGMIISLIWMVCIVQSILVNYVLRRLYVFDEKVLVVYYIDAEDLEGQPKLLLEFINNANPVFISMIYNSSYIMIIAYVAMFVKLLKDSGDSFSKWKSRELKFLLQGVIICGMFLLERQMHDIVAHRIFGCLPNILPLNVASNCLTILLSTTQPLAIFTFNSAVRKQLFALFGIQRKVDRSRSIVVYRKKLSSTSSLKSTIT
ncbi:hypothetical protein DdX_11813 [Ditylenchus destructor]|uniref:Uncharacterized protein n=1 Tax=Ditylenchus destructor TaxID=166010 RepID=A0AAD4R3Z3_9BILA|nr:hypothetical protein DdX_11813 [Ditylenchus destructor]